MTSKLVFTTSVAAMALTLTGQLVGSSVATAIAQPPKGSVTIEKRGDHTIYVLRDPAAGTSARVLSSYGFNCYSFICRVGDKTYDVLHSVERFDDRPSDPMRNGIPILFPFPNRIRDGRFSFGGKSYELGRNLGPNAIHGFVLDRPWRVVSTGPGASVTGRFQLSVDAPELRAKWPADFQLDMTYELTGNRLTSKFRVHNPDQSPLPWGFGTHPYFRLPLSDKSAEDRCTVFVPAAEQWELVEFLPTGKRLPVTGVFDLRRGQPFSKCAFDHAFGGLTFNNGWATARVVDGVAGVSVEQRVDRAFREFVVYTPPKRGEISLEPYSCVTDAINLQPRGIDAGLQTLAPKATAEGTIVIEASAAQ